MFQCSSPFSDHIQKDILDCTLNTRAQFECFTSCVQIQIRFDEWYCVSVSCRDGNGSILMGRVIMGSSGHRHNLPSHFLLSPPPSEYRIRARTPGHCALRVLLLEVGRARAELGTGHYTGQVRLLVLQCYISTASHLQGWTFRIEIHDTDHSDSDRYSYSLYRAYWRRAPF